MPDRTSNDQLVQELLKRSAGKPEGLPDDIPEEDMERVVQWATMDKDIAPEYRRDLPYVPQPAMFRKKPLIISPKLQEAYTELINNFPEAVGSAGQITGSPTPGVIEMLQKSKISPLNYGGTNLSGAIDRGDEHKRVYVNESHEGLDPHHLSGTMAHEISHQRGYREPTADLVGEMYRRLMNKRDVAKMPPQNNSRVIGAGVTEGQLRELLSGIIKDDEKGVVKGYQPGLDK